MHSSKYLSRCLKNSIFRKSQNIKSFTQDCRGYLSSAFQCQEAWDKRLEEEAVKKIMKPGDNYIELNKKYRLENVLWALDIDLYLHRLTPDSPYLNVSDIEWLLQKIRLTTQSLEIFPSTDHQVLRLLLESGNTDGIFKIISDPVKYGIFPCNYTATLLIDAFLKKKDYSRAARVASTVAIQESLDPRKTPSTSERLLLSLMNHSLLHGAIHTPEEGDDPWKKHYEDPCLWDKTKEKPEMIRKDYPVNPCFDDHFDLRNDFDLVYNSMMWRAFNHDKIENDFDVDYWQKRRATNLMGKTLTWRCLFSDIPQGEFKNNSLICGYALWQKWEKVENLLKTNGKQPLSDYTIDLVEKMLDKYQEDDEKIVEGTVPWAIKHDIELFPVRWEGRLMQLCDLPAYARTHLSMPTPEWKARVREVLKGASGGGADLLAMSEGFVQEEVAKGEETFVQEQLDVFKQWENYRKEQCEFFIEEKKKMELMDEIARKKQELKAKNQLITYFDKEDKLHLCIAANTNYNHPFPRRRPNYYYKKNRSKSAVDEEYFPPEVRATRNIK